MKYVYRAKERRSPRGCPALILFFVLLTIEKVFLLKYLKKGRIWPHIYTLFFVVLGWGIFTANVEGAALPLLMSRLFLPSGGISAVYYLRNYGVLLVLCAFCSTALPRKIWQWARRHTPVRLVLLAAAMILSVAFVVASTNNAPLYGNF